MRSGWHVLSWDNEELHVSSMNISACEHHEHKQHSQSQPSRPSVELSLYTSLFPNNRRDEKEGANRLFQSTCTAKTVLICLSSDLFLTVLIGSRTTAGRPWKPLWLTQLASSRGTVNLPMPTSGQSVLGQYVPSFSSATVPAVALRDHLTGHMLISLSLPSLYLEPGGIVLCTGPLTLALALTCLLAQESSNANADQR